MTTEPLKVLIADDHPIFRDGLRALIGTMPNAALVGEASTGDEAVEAALELQPDVVVMDLRMPEMSGLEATRRIVGSSPHIAVLVITMSDDDESLFAAMRAGARGYIVKGADRAEIVRAIESVGAGEAIFAPSVAVRIAQYFSARDAADSQLPFPQLTEREREVLDLVAQGRNNQTIANRLGVSTKTVRNHVSNIFTKLQVADRAEAIVRARDAGLGSRPT